MTLPIISTLIVCFPVASRQSGQHIRATSEATEPGPQQQLYPPPDLPGEISCLKSHSLHSLSGMNITHLKDFIILDVSLAGIMTNLINLLFK